MNTQNQILYTLKNTSGLFRGIIYFILVLFFFTEVADQIISQDKQVWTDASLSPSDVPYIAAVGPSLDAQNQIYFFIYWIFQLHFLRPFIFIVSPLIFLSAIKNKLGFIFYVISGLLGFFVFAFITAYQFVVILTCENYAFCRGRTVPWDGTPSLDIIFNISVNAFHIVGGLVVFVLALIIVRSYNPKAVGRKLRDYDNKL